MSGFAGILRERVTLERRGDERDEIGGASGAWTELALAWASVRPDGRYAGAGDDALRGRRRWLVDARPCDARVGDRLGRVSGELLVTGVWRDPATPDRILIEAEDLP